MGQSDDVEDSTFTKHQDLCQKLNMDAVAASEAWKSYENIRQHYTLEGDQLHWIGCALYVACRKANIPTVGRSGVSIQGNCVSLTKLLKLCNLPLLEFFTKSKAWADMCNMPQDFGARIDVLQKTFSVSSIIFQKYQPIFMDIFKNPSEDASKPVRVRRHKTAPCTPSRLFEFCWTFFIYIKSGIALTSDDLVNSYHLLIACCDLMYSNALLANRKDLLNPNFEGLPENFNDDDFVPPISANCIITTLCKRYNAIVVEAVGLKEYNLKRALTKFFNEKTLRGDASNFSGILDALNFDGNSKAINKAYEQHVLSVGNLDERIFLADWRRARIEGMSRVQVIDGEIAWHLLSKGPDDINNIGSSESKKSKMSDLQEQFQPKKEQSTTIPQLGPPTPLTGRKYLKSKEIANAASANLTQSVIRLQALLGGSQTWPSENLLEIFKNSNPDAQTFVETKIQEFGQMFCDAYTPKSIQQSENGLDFGKKRMKSAKLLFYKILEMVLIDEKSKKQTSDVSNLLRNERFLQCLFACCCEIVIYSYQNKDRLFPWILKALNIEAYFFYKVIEVIIKVSVDQLTRDMVKHLNRIEEMILESLAWKSGSPLWEALENLKSKDKNDSNREDDFKSVPSYEEVALPGTFDLVDPNTPGQPILRRIALDRGTQPDVPQSPISSASDRFQSPIRPAAVAKRNLFPDAKPPLSVSGSSQSILKSGSPLSRNDQRYISTINRDQSKPKRTGSLALFFRKFYNLTNTRMQTLCSALEITDDEHKRKIWTIFEHTIRERTEIMKDRHLDQILMSSVYVICKLCKIDKNTFTEIMRCYRLQPQAESHIYRSVLIKRVSQNNTNPTVDNSNRSPTRNVPPTPSEMAATSQIYDSEERGDLIKFYNTVYVPKVKDFAKHLDLSEKNTANLTLSPLPKPTRQLPQCSPVRRVTESVMTRVLDPNEIAASPAPTLNYCFNRSPAKDLEQINQMVSVDARKCVGKRLLSEEAEIPFSSTDGEPAIKKILVTTTTTATTASKQPTTGGQTLTTITTTTNVTDSSTTEEKKNTETKEVTEASTTDETDSPMIDETDSTATTTSAALIARRIGNIVGERRTQNP